MWEAWREQAGSRAEQSRVRAAAEQRVRGDGRKLD